MGLATVHLHQPEKLLLEAISSVSLPFFLAPVTPARDWLRGQPRYGSSTAAISGADDRSPHHSAGSRRTVHAEEATTQLR